MFYIQLNNGYKMPQIGLGTYAIPHDRMSYVIGKAFDYGYRKFDTAQYYNNHSIIATSLKENKIERSNIFLTTKISEPMLYRFSRGKRFSLNQKSIKSVVHNCFRELKTDFLDMVMVHYPYWRYWKVWETLSEFYHKGEIRAIGLSSFLPPVIDSLKDYSDVTPALNQFEISPLNTQKQLIAYCQQNNIAVGAISTFSHYRSSEVRNEIINSEVIAPIAEKHNKTIPQVVLRWLLQQGISIIPKSTSDKHLMQNIQLDDFFLTPDEMAIIDAMDKGIFLNYNPYPGLSNIPTSYNRWKQFLTYSLPSHRADDESALSVYTGV